METSFSGLSGFHQLVISIFKTIFSKLKLKDIKYREFKKFSEQTFNQKRILKHTNECVNFYSRFEPTTT